MAVKRPYSNVVINGITLDTISVEVAEGHEQTCARFSVEVEDTTGIDLNDTVTIKMGYVGDNGIVFKGYVDEIVQSRMPGTYSIKGRDVLKRAIEHYLVTTNIDNPWSRSHITAENLVRDLLKEAGITDYSGAHTSFTFGTQCPAEFNLMSSWDAIRTICNIIAYNCYCVDGRVYFQRVFPIPTIPAPPGSFELKTGTGGNTTFIDYGYNTDNLRNQVIVFGLGGIYAEAHSATTPCPPGWPAPCTFLPAGFYKTAIVSSEFIDSDGMAEDSAKYNLELYNKLTESLRIEAEGDHRLRCRDTVTVTDLIFTGMNADEWFVFSITHKISDEGYTMSVNLSR